MIEAAELDRNVAELPVGWSSICVADALARKRGETILKLQTSEYFNEGALPIVDQGAQFICGYTDDLAAVYPYSLPVIVFGDHTRTLKYVDFPFAVGADGTQCLHPNANFDDRFFFYSLQNIDLKSEGYARHFKLLKEQTIACPPLDEQRRIAEVLRSVDEAIAAADGVICQLRETRSHRLEALMTLPGAYRRIDEVCRLSGGFGFPIKHQGKGSGRYPFAKVSDMNRPGNEVLMRNAENYVDDADIRTLKAKTFPVGTTFFPKVGATLLTNKRRIAAVEMLVDNNVMGAVATDVDPWFLYYAFCTIDMADYVQPGAVPSVNQRTIGQIIIPVPDKAAQVEFVETMRALDASIETQSKALGQLTAAKQALMFDLLSGRVRVPVPLVTPAGRTAPPAFKRAVFAAEIVHQLHNDNRFGAVKLEKIVHLSELHLGLQDDIHRHAYKEAAGPYDPKARRSVEKIFQQQRWFDATKPHGNRVVYEPLEKAGGHAEFFDRYFAKQKDAIQSIIDLLRPLNMEQCEIVATLYAVWNDFLIDGKQPTEKEIVASVLHWHPKKQEIGEDRWLAALPWMRQKGLIPKGTGEKTRVAQA